MFAIWLLVAVFMGIASMSLYYLFLNVYDKYKERRCLSDCGCSGLLSDSLVNKNTFKEITS